MKLLSIFISAIFLYSCANTSTVSKKISYEPKINIKNGKTFSIIVNSSERNTPYISGVIRNASRFSAQSFENLLTENLSKRSGFKIIDRASASEALSDLISGRKQRRATSDYLIFINYEEIKGVAPYSSDLEGRKSKVYFAKARVAYKIVNTKNSQLIDSGSFFQRFQEQITDYIYVNGEQIVGPNTDNVAMKVRRYLASEFSDLFQHTKKNYLLKFKNGNKDKFLRVSSLIKENKVDDALKLQSKLMKKADNKSDRSDGNYNLALIYLLLKDKQKARSHAAQVTNGFIAKDFNEISNLIQEMWVYVQVQV